MTKKEKEALLKKSEGPEPIKQTPEELELGPQTIKQLKIALANSQYAPIIIDLIKDCMPQISLVGKSEYETVVNAITFDVRSEIIRRMVDLLAEIRQGSMHEIK